MQELSEKRPQTEKETRHNNSYNTIFPYKFSQYFGFEREKKTQIKKVLFLSKLNTDL